MKSSKKMDSKVIIYDDVCPLCKAYTSGFVHIGWLRPENRLGFAEASPELLRHIDIDRARHEIPLYDKVTGETLYGKEALFFIIGEAVPVFRPLFRWRWFRGLIFALYQLITYNRRIIANSRPPASGFDCAPDFHVFYRWLYIGMMGMFATWLSLKAGSQPAWYIPALTSFTAFATIYGISIPDFKKQTDYFGHLATVLFIVGFLSFVVSNLPVAVPAVLVFGVWLFYRRVK